jgi:excisionase family DNA binding protein
VSDTHRLGRATAEPRPLCEVPERLFGVGRLRGGQRDYRSMQNDSDNGPPVTNTKLAYGVVEAARALGVSRSALYELNKQGAIRFVKCGRRTLILHEDLVAFLQSLR